ncbi:MAG: FAD-dependent oxidoreductase, partial [Chloroflexi bacterium]|nr:FAD-dependent oxidoreductase [Chloroflexota bacterium]
MERVVIVGASLAGLNAAEALRDDGFEGRITLIGEEPQPPYDRPPLSKQLLTGEWDTERLPLRSEDELTQLQLEFLGGRAATGLDVGQRLVSLHDGQSVEFDGLIIASGARAIRLPFGQDLAGVHALRSQADALRIRDDLEAGGKLVVIGGGFIGAEVASSARARGLDVAMVEALPAPMVGPLGEELADWAANLHLEAGVSLHMSLKVTDLVGSVRVEAVELEDGSRIAADTIVVGVGVRPNVEWLEGSGLTISDGVVCDQFCRAAPMIYAAGDVARWPNVLFTHFRYDQPQRTMRIEHWTNAVEQGMAAARNLLLESRGEALEAFAPVPYFWSDQHGLSIMASGVTSPRDEFQLVHGSLESNRFAAIYGLRGHL